MNGSAENLSDAFNPLLAVWAWRARWRLSLATFVTVFMMAAIFLLQVRPKYESEASLFVRLGRESAGLDPTATTSEVAPIYETREQELNSALEVMRSRKLLEAVIDVIGEDSVLHPERFSFEAWQQALADTNWRLLDPDVIHRSTPEREIAVEKLYRSVTPEVEDSSSVITITSVAATPELAQAITKTMLDAFHAEHVRLNQTHGLKFFNEQVQLLESRLSQARQQLIQRRNELGINSIEGERARLEDVLTSLEKQLNQTVPDFAGALASTRAMEEQVRLIPERTQPHDASDTLRKKLHELEQRRAALLTRFTPLHYLVQDTDAEIEQVRMQLSDPRNKNAANPALRELEVALATDRSRVAQSSATIEELRKAHQQVRNQLVRLNEAEAEILALKDQTAELQSATMKIKEKREQARLLDELTRRRISNIRIVQPPTFNPVSMSLSRSAGLALDSVVAVIAAVVVPAVVEFLAWYVSMIRRASASDNQVSSGDVIACGG